MTTNDRTAIINDRYEIFRRIGRGGMADVFLGRDRLLDRQVAIKVLFPEFAVDPNFVERFRREAQAAANLSHPNIVNVYDWGRHAGTYFIAMEYVQGRTLADILRANGHVTSKQAAEIASEVAAALGFAHEAGLVHRDIKPANILIGSNGQVKVADFGIARAMNAPTESNLTQAGAVMGTATYFSPEQAQGAQPDPRSDLYSLGVVMYEMIAGRPPFTGENPVSIAYKQVHDHPQPLNRLVADVPRPFEAIVAKLLAKDPRIRYSSAGALRDDLRRFRNGEPVMALASLSGGRATGATGAATVPLAATAGAATASAAATAATAAMTSQPTAVGAPVPPPGDRPTGASSAARYYEPRPSRTGWYALAAFFALVALGIGALLLFNALSGGRESGSRTLADYVGRPLTEVTAELDQLELTYTVQAEENNSFGIGVVHRTDPVAGTVVVDGQVITLFFNPEPQLQAVPDVAGQTVEAAIRTLGASGFGVGTQTTETSDEFDEGEVIRTDPPAREQVRQDTAINLVVSSGPERRALPSEVIGLTEERARALLGAAPYEFDVSATTEVSDSVEAGRVIRTDPAPGVLVARGANVTLVVSRGPAPLTVPDVRGLSEDAARAELAGFDVDTTTRALPAGDSRDGEVITQSLSPGAEAPRGSSIVLEIGAAAEPEPEPDPEPAPPAATTTTAPIATAPPGT